MSPEIEQRLADFERRHKPDSKSYLLTFREEVVYLYFKGYSLKRTFEYLKEQGVGCSLRTFERWVKEAIDFRQEECPQAAKRARPWPAESKDEGQGGHIRRPLGPVAQRALVSEEGGGFSLAGAAADAPELTGRPAKFSSEAPTPGPAELPKLPVLVEETLPKSPILVHSHSATTKSSAREAALALARERREKVFKNPVDRALEDQDRSK